MSRHVISKTDAREVVVGWDPPLNTFFAQEYDLTVADDEEDLVWWIGYEMNECPEIMDLVKALHERGWEITIEDCEKLAQDKGVPWEPGPLQKHFLDIMRATNN